MPPLGFIWVLKVCLYSISYKEIWKYPSSALPQGGIHRKIKGGDSAKGRVGVNGHFLMKTIEKTIVFENSQKNRRALKEPLIQQHVYF